MCKCALDSWKKMQLIGGPPKESASGRFPIPKNVCNHVGKKYVSKVTKIRRPWCEWTIVPRSVLCLDCGLYIMWNISSD